MSMRPAPMPTPPRARSGSDSRFLQATRRMSIAVDVLRGGRRDLSFELGDAGLDGISDAVDQLAYVHPEYLSGSTQGCDRYYRCSAIPGTHALAGYSYQL